MHFVFRCKYYEAPYNGWQVSHAHLDVDPKFLDSKLETYPQYEVDSDINMGSFV